MDAQLTLGSIAQLLLVVGLCIVILIVILVVYGLCIYVKDLLADPYTEGRIGFWKYGTFGQVFYGRSLGGFRVAYRLSGNIMRVDNEEFKKERMLEKANLGEFAKRFHSDVFLRYLQPRGAWFFVYSWTNLLRESGIITCEPILFLYKAVLDDEDKQLKLEFDANGVDLSRSVISWMNENSWHSHGCCIEVLLINEVMEPSLIEENYNMLTPEQRASAKEHERYLLAEELAAVAALKRQLDFLEPSGEHRNGDLSIRYSVVGQSVRIEWEISAESLRKGYRVRGFRREESFCWNEYSQTENGKQFMSSAVSDVTIDHPPAGSVQFYSFMLTRPVEAEKVDCQDSVRFQVRIPQENDLRELRQVLEKARDGRVAAADPADKKIRQLLKDLTSGVETEKILKEAQKKIENEIRTNPNHSDAEKEDLLNRIGIRFEFIRDKLFE